MTELRSALVTGASRGIGQAIAIALAERGHKVYCVSTTSGGCDTTVSQCAERGGNAVAMTCDVSDQASVESLAAAVLSEVGALDVLVNNAGITRDGAFMRMSTDDFDRVVEVNLRGAFLLARGFVRGMAKARRGRIVNVGSVVGVMGNAGQVNYAASKAGLIGLTKALAKELGGRGVTLNYGNGTNFTISTDVRALGDFCCAICQ
jgi:3-oxoacyl-[acyl-carrier protein] reductase